MSPQNNTQRYYEYVGKQQWISPRQARTPASLNDLLQGQAAGPTHPSKQADAAGIHTERAQNIPFRAILSIIGSKVCRRRERVVVDSRAQNRFERSVTLLEKADDLGDVAVLHLVLALEHRKHSRWMKVRCAGGKLTKPLAAIDLLAVVVAFSK